MLLAAVNGPQLPLAERALDTLLSRDDPIAHRLLLTQFHGLEAALKEVVRRRPGRLTEVLREAVLSADASQCAAGCEAVLWLYEYDLLPTLINAAEDPANPQRELVSATIVSLVERLYEELARPRDYANRRDPQLVRQRLISCLEQSVQRYTRHRLESVLEAFLLLVHRDNVTLKQILHDPRHAAFLPIVDLLTHNLRAGVLRLTLGFADDPEAPSAAISVLAHRDDQRFIELLLRKIAEQPSEALLRNLHRLDNIVWLQADFARLDNLDEANQRAVVQLVSASNLKREAALRVVEHLLKHGKVAGRRAAAEALEKFSGADANALTLSALDDSDPHVQASAIQQIRQRGIPGSFSRLIRFVDSPHQVVRDALCQSLAEFSFKRYLAAFDSLQDEVRVSSGAMVRKIDPQTAEQLAEELTARAPGRRLRGVKMTIAIGITTAVEPELIQLLSDNDHLVRCEAARALATSKSAAAREALEECLIDRSVSVQLAAGLSLQEIQTPTDVG